MPINMQQANDLKHHLLIAMPSLKDSLFESTVIYLCEHNEDGAMGLVLNRKLPVEFYDICEQLQIPYKLSANPIVLDGGPVSPEHGFILHRQTGSWNSTFSVDAEAHLTSSKDILKAIANGTGPQDYIIALGYAGWDKAQLENELSSNAWLTTEANSELLFETPIDELYQAALAKIGVSVEFLSSQTGRA